MASTCEPYVDFLQRHSIAIRLEDNILVWGNLWPTVERGTGIAISGHAEHEIWTYNLWTEQWKEHILSPEERAKDIVIGSKCGVVMGSDAYIFATHRKDKIYVLWKVTRCTNGSTNSSTVPLISNTIRSRIYSNCNWEHGNKLWIFDGSQNINHNELFCCDPSAQTLTRVISSGSVPSPRATASAAAIKDKVWLCGGFNDFDFHELDMHSFSWTKIEAGMPQPLRGMEYGSLTAIQDNQLILYGDKPSVNSTWIFDVESCTWKAHFQQDLFPRYRHSDIVGLNGDVIILGGYLNVAYGKNTGATVYEPVVNVRLSPKSLQQLAMRIVYGNRTSLPWKSLPPKLIRKLIDTDTE